VSFPIGSADLRVVTHLTLYDRMFDTGYIAGPGAGGPQKSFRFLDRHAHHHASSEARQRGNLCWPERRSGLRGLELDSAGHIDLGSDTAGLGRHTGHAAKPRRHVDRTLGEAALVGRFDRPRRAFCDERSVRVIDVPAFPVTDSE